MLFAAFMLFCCFAVLALALIAGLAEWLFEVLASWTVVAGNLQVTLSMLSFFLGRRRRTLHEFLSESYARRFSPKPPGHQSRTSGTAGRYRCRTITTGRVGLAERPRRPGLVTPHLEPIPTSTSRLARAGMSRLRQISQ